MGSHFSMKRMSFKEGDDIQIIVKAKDKMEVEKKPGVEELLAILNKYSGRPRAQCRCDDLGDHPSGFGSIEDW